MSERPIIFSGPMVRALLDGRKTQTRRLATSPLRRTEPGDKLWVREAYRLPKAFDSDSPCKAAERVKCFGPNRFYEADGAIKSAGAHTGEPGKLRPSIHMPRWASRLTLRVADVRVEPLQSISDADARAEGVTDEMIGNAVRELDTPLPATPWIGAYAWLWISLHGAELWASNPDVVVLTFSVVP